MNFETSKRDFENALAHSHAVINEVADLLTEDQVDTLKAPYEEYHLWLKKGVEAMENEIETLQGLLDAAMK